MQIAWCDILVALLALSTEVEKKAREAGTATSGLGVSESDRLSAEESEPQSVVVLLLVKADALLFLRRHEDALQVM
jgi:hypothetical protein